MTHVRVRAGLLLLALLSATLVRADSSVDGIFSTVSGNDAASFREAARRAQAEAGWWFARHGNVSREFTGFRGYFIKVRDIGTVQDNFSVGAIVTGEEWDNTRAPSFKISFDPGGPSTQWVSVANLTFLGREWHPNYLKIRDALIGADAGGATSARSTPRGVFGLDRSDDDYLDNVIREALSRAGRWMPSDKRAEFTGFRGYFIKVFDSRDGVSDNFDLGAIVRGVQWDGSDAPKFQKRLDSGSAETQWMSSGNLTFLGEEWDPDFERLYERFRALAR